MKHSRILIALLLILAVVAVGCDDQSSMLTDGERAFIAGFGFEIMLIIDDYIDGIDGSIANQLPPGLVISNDGGNLNKKITLTDFDFYDLAIFEGEDEQDLIDAGAARNQLVITSGSATLAYELIEAVGPQDEDEFNVVNGSIDFNLKINNAPFIDVPNGTYRIQIEGPQHDDPASAVFKVDGVKVSLEDMGLNP